MAAETIARGMLCLKILPSLPAPGAPLTATQVLHIEGEVVATVHLVDEIGPALEWKSKAKAIEAYLRSPELQRPLLGAQRRIEGRIGQLLGEPIHGGSQVGHAQLEHNLLIDKHDRFDFRLLGRALSGECPLTEDEWRKSRRSLVALVRQRLGLMPETPALPDGQFQCIVADPPWQLSTGPDVFHGTGESGGIPLAYPTMPVEQIRTLTDKSGRFVGKCAAENAHLYLWTTSRYVEPAHGIARAWGFEPSTLLTWCKTPRGVGLGGDFKLTSEFVLYCRRGNLEALSSVPTTWFEWPRGRHSKKPDAFYEMVESVTPGTPETRLDLFARTERDGWVCWGDEVA